MLIVFGHLRIIGGSRKLFFFLSQYPKETQHLVCCGFLLDSTILYIEPKHTKSLKWCGMVRHHKASTDGKEDNNGLQAVIVSFGLQVGLNQRSP